MINLTDALAVVSIAIAVVAAIGVFQVWQGVKNAKKDFADAIAAFEEFKKSVPSRRITPKKK